MKAILMTSAALAVLASPAFAVPDRSEAGNCGATSGAARTDCMQQEMVGEVSNRHFSKTVDTSAQVGTASPALQGVGAGSATTESDEDLNDEVGDTADEAGDAISNTADDTGNAITNTADEAGDSISNAADEAGEAISDAFN